MAIKTPFGPTPFNTAQVAEALTMSQEKTTQTIRRLADRVVGSILADPNTWTQSARPDRIAGAVAECVLKLGRLAHAHPAAFRRWIRELTDWKLTVDADAETPQGKATAQSVAILASDLSDRDLRAIKRHSLKPADCLHHATVALNLWADGSHCPCTVCMGPCAAQPEAHTHTLHCWLETPRAVIDLATPQRFFLKCIYYARFGILNRDVKRYTRRQVARWTRRDGEPRFWGLEDTEAESPKDPDDGPV